MKTKKTSKITFFVLLVLIATLVFTAFFGIDGYYGDTRNVYIKGAQDIRWGIDISGGVEAVFSPDIKDAEITDEDMASAKAIIETRLVNQNITDYEVYSDNANNQIIVRFPWSAGESEFDAAKAVSELGETALLTFCGDEDRNNVLLSGAADIASASPAVLEDGQYVVSLKFTEAGKNKFAAACKKYKQISIWMDNIELSAPTVSEDLASGKNITNEAVIEGNFDAQAVTLGTSTIRGIERKKPRLQLTKPDTAVRAGIIFAIGEGVFGVFRFLHGYQPLGILKCQFQGFDDSFPFKFLYINFIGQQFDGVFFVAFQGGGRI